MQSVPGTHAADQLHHVRKQLADLQKREQQLRQQLSDTSLHALEQINRSGNSLPDDEPAQRPLPDLLQEAKVLETGAKYLGRLEVS